MSSVPCTTLRASIRVAPCLQTGWHGGIFLPLENPNTTLEYLTTTKIGEKGQLTVPKQFREELGLGNGAPFAVLRLGDGLILFARAAAL